MVEHEHQTRYREMTASIQLVADAQVEYEKRLNDLASSFDYQKRLLQEVAGRLSSMQNQRGGSKFTSGSTTTLSMSTSYHPQSDGLTEALNKCLEMYLRCYVADHPKAWVSMLPWAEFWYNTAYQTSTQMTPFEVLYGRKPPTIARYIRNSSGYSVVESQMLERDQVLLLLKNNLRMAQARMKAYANGHRREEVLAIGDWVYVKLQPFRQNSIRLQRHSKLGRKYFRPYKVLARVGTVAYKLALSESTQIYLVFHVSLLKKCIGNPDQQVTPLHLVDSNASMILEPVAILDVRSVQRGLGLVDQWLVQWECMTVVEATWEDKSHMLQLYPALNLEDKVPLQGEGSVVKGVQPTNDTVMGVQSTNDTGSELGQTLRRSTRARTASRRLIGYD